MRGKKRVMNLKRLKGSEKTEKRRMQRVRGREREGKKKRKERNKRYRQWVGGGERQGEIYLHLEIGRDRKGDRVKERDR